MDKYDLIILSGGFGSRLQSVSKGIPKSLLPIGNVVFLDLIMKRIHNYNIGNIYLSLHYKHDLFDRYIKKRPYFRKIKKVVEPRPLGTGGAIKFVSQNVKITSPFFVINGDTITNLNLNELASSFFKNDYDAMIGITFVKNVSRYGQVRFDRNGSLIEFMEKANNNSGWISNGQYIIKEKILNKFTGAFSIEKDVFPAITEEGRIGVFPLKNDKFFDIGIPEDYFKLAKLKNMCPKVK
jgi:D-glycero-alpha-D-manno-heptose 1-phosphate guanylyltransferase